MSLTLVDGHRMGWEHFSKGCDRECGPFNDRKSKRSRRMRSVRAAWLAGWDDAFTKWAEIAAEGPVEVLKEEVRNLYAAKPGSRPM